MVDRSVDEIASALAGLVKCLGNGARFTISAADALAILADRDAKAQALAAAEQDALEQARLVGMGAERELALMAKVKEAEGGRDEAQFLYNLAEAAVRKEQMRTNTVVADRDALKAKLGRAREALRPFAKHAEFVCRYEGRGEFAEVYDGAIRRSISTDDFDGARAILAELDADQPKEKADDLA